MLPPSAPPTDDAERRLAAYAAARAQPRAIVSPQILPGAGFLVGYTYLVQVLCPDAESLSWSVAKQPDVAFASGAPCAVASDARAVAAGVPLARGTTRAFGFTPPASGRYTIALNFEQPDVGFTDSLVIHAPASEGSRWQDILIAVGALAASALLVGATAGVCAALMRGRGR